jgi:hypothetical protein
VPNQAHSGWKGDPWHHCDRCGCDYHTSELKPQKGLLVCRNCVDNLLVEERSSVIQQVLANRPDAPPAFVLQEPTFEEIEDLII